MQFTVANSEKKGGVTFSKSDSDAPTMTSISVLVLTPDELETPFIRSLICPSNSLTGIYQNVDLTLSKSPLAGYNAQHTLPSVVWGTMLSCFKCKTIVCMPFTSG